ncbi:MAG TPA: benzoate/H(+) symporter BenE family transporter [Chloroflexota bacterium]|jgi:benzoate membrane transport protein
MSSAVFNWPARRSPLLLGERLRDLNPAAVSAGITAFIFYVTAGVPLLIAIAGRLGLDTAHTSSWFFIVFFSTAVTSIVLSLVFRQPLPLNWSLPGLLYLGSLAGHFSFAELVGANVMAGVVIVLIGLLRIGPRLVALLPLPIAMGMFAGSILGALSGLVVATVEDVSIAGATVAGYVLGRLIGRRSLPPVGLAAVSGALAIALAQRVAWAPIDLAPPLLLVPEATFSLSALIGISLPLVVLSLGLGNVQGLGYLRAQGYRAPINLLTLVVGGQSLLNALFGGHQAILGRSGVAILAAPEAGPVSGRYWGCVVANGLLLPVAFAAGPLAALLPMVPASYLAALAGLAILPSFQEAIQHGFGGRLRFGATVAFLVAATPFSLVGIPSAFWSLLAGLVASHITERAELNAPAGDSASR